MKSARAAGAGVMRAAAILWVALALALGCSDPAPAPAPDCATCEYGAWGMKPADSEPWRLFCKSDGSRSDDTSRQCSSADPEAELEKTRRAHEARAEMSCDWCQLGWCTENGSQIGWCEGSNPRGETGCKLPEHERVYCEMRRAAGDGDLAFRVWAALQRQRGA